ncbi:MAG: M23 family metallopeptidase [Deltaproteobacteria bacterium]|nr:M23 family metallopeptidase [Deltaproteobacteria bacterium]
MKHYTLMLVGDERSPVRRFQITGTAINRGIAAAAVALLISAAATWDYWRMRSQNSELASLRVEAAEQREQIDHFQTTLSDMSTELTRVQELERKVRIIANLPGAAAVGGAGVTERVPVGPEGEVVGEDMLRLPVGVPIDLDHENHAPGQGDEPLSQLMPEDAALEGATGVTTDKARHVRRLEEKGRGLVQVADHRALSLVELIDQLEDKSTRLASLPSVWPARGWLTSRYGPRISPYTGRRQMHSGIDIAAREGTEIVSPARGRVSFVGRKGPLGNALMVDHGFGVKTVYGHTSKIHVKAGDEVQRGQLIAAIGSTGRSTGPHLHYVVQVKGKTKNPLDYIFD